MNNESTRQICEVKYQIATYSGIEKVFCDHNEDNEVIFARCRKQLSRNAPLPFGYESFKIISREYINENENDLIL